MCSGKLTATDTADTESTQCRVRFEKKRKICICRVSFERNCLWSLSSCLKWIWREVSLPGTGGTKATFDRQTQVCSQKEGEVIMRAMRVMLRCFVKWYALAQISECCHFPTCYICHLKFISWEFLRFVSAKCKMSSFVSVWCVCVCLCPYSTCSLYSFHTPQVSFQWRKLPCQLAHATLEINSAPLNIKPDLNVWKKSKSDLWKKKKESESAKKKKGKEESDRERGDKGNGI